MQSDHVEFDLGDSILQLLAQMGERGSILRVYTVGENLLHLEDLTALENLSRPLDLELHGNPFICDFEHCWLRKEYR